MFSATQLLLGLLAFFSSSLAKNTCLPDSEPLISGAEGCHINLGYSNWLSSQLNVEVIKILLREKFGCTSDLISLPTLESFQALADNRIHAYPELWNDHEKAKKLKDPSIAYAGSLGIVGKVGVYVPDYVLGANSEFISYLGLKIPENTKIFSPGYSGSINGTSREKIAQRLAECRNMSETLSEPLSNFLPVQNSTWSESSLPRGLLYTPSKDSGWTTYEQEFISELGLHLEASIIDTSDIEKGLIENIQSHYQAGKPLLTYFWTPHQIHDPRSGVTLKRMQMVDWDDKCRQNPNRAACYYPNDEILMLLSAHLRAESPMVFDLLKNFQYQSNDDQNVMLADVFFDSMQPEEAACKWIKDNRDYLQKILPNATDNLYQKYSDASSMTTVILAVFFMITSLAIMFIINLWRNDPVVKAANLGFCNAILIGSFFAYLSVFMFIGKPTVATCVLQPVFLSFGYVLMYCSLVLKNLRIWKIYHNPFKSQFAATNIQVLIFEVVVLTIELVILMAWFFTDPPLPGSRALDGGEVIHFCSGRNPQIGVSFAWTLFFINALLVLFGVVLVVLTRKVHSEFNEGRFIGFAIYNVFIIGIITVPLVTLGIIQNSTARFTLLTLAILFSSAFTVLALFVPKILFVFFPHLGPQHSVNSINHPNRVSMFLSKDSAHAHAQKEGEKDRVHDTEVAMDSPK